MKEIRSFIGAAAVLLVGSVGTINHFNQSSSTEWIGQHLQQKQDALEQLQAQIDDLNARLNDIQNPPGSVGHVMADTNWLTVAKQKHLPIEIFDAQ